MIGADGFVAIGNGCLLSDKQRAVILEPIKTIAAVFKVDLQMFRCIVIGEPDGFVPVIGDVKLAVVGPGDFRDIFGRQHRELFSEYACVPV